MLALLFEFIGTFVFFYVIANVGDPLSIAAAFFGAVVFAAKVSGANLNPGVSFMMYLLKRIDATTLLQYALVQLLAGTCVVVLHNSPLLFS
jgi:glycerol uptake facilitator-like aquaporin